MIVFLDLVPIHAFRRRKLREGSRFFLTLSGVSITTAGGVICVEPVYSPLLSFDRRGRLVFVEIAWGKALLLVVLSPWRPFLHIEKIHTGVLEDE